jgi:Xaa-Pro aminopeptidase
MLPSPAQLSARLATVRRHISDSSLDALVITHPPNIFYLTNLSASAGVVVLDREACHLLVDGRYQSSARALVRTERTCAGAVVVPVEHSYEAALAELLSGGAWPRVGFEADHLTVSRYRWLESTLRAGSGTPRNLEMVPVSRLVERARLIKDEFEIATFRRAAELLGEIVKDLPTLLRVHRTERDIAAELDYRLRIAGFAKPAFETIAASGPNSALPHARPTDRRPGRREPIVLDFGGVYDGYCVDLTRTLAMGELPPEAFRVWSAVAEAQDRAIEAIAPGRLASEVDAAARAALARHGLAEAFTHGTGHGLGLEVHEEPPIRRRPPAGSAGGAEDVVLRAGMVFTVEPGAYLPGQFGVRIEDDVLVNSRGCEVLTR